MQVGVGKDVEAVCRKCGEVWHVIVAVEAGSITRVQCKECMAYHRYKPPAGEARIDRPAATSIKRAAANKKASRKSGGRRKKASKQVFDEPIIDPDLSRPVRAYDMTEVYAAGDRVEHPKFGEGVVEMSPGPGKINVFFEDGRRTLAHDRQ